mgnify:CR=1 FL=1
MILDPIRHRVLKLIDERDSDLKTASLALDHSSYGAQFIDRFCFSAGWTP